MDQEEAYANALSFLVLGVTRDKRRPPGAASGPLHHRIISETLAASVNDRRETTVGQHVFG